MFKLSPDMIEGFRLDPQPRATAADLALVEAGIGCALPAPYKEFVTQQGFVVFGNDQRRLCLFDCRYDQAGQTVVRRGDIAFLHDPRNVLKAWRNFTAPPASEDDSMPAFPAEYLPVGNSAGQSQILLELSPTPGRVWYWRESEWRWGTGENTALGFVADDFYDFINNLQPDPL